MTESFRVWASLPQKVELELGSRRLPMRKDEGGWWSLSEGGAVAGDDYGFVLDGQGPFPDPRSQCQPHGVHGLSRVPSRAAFPWRDEGFNAVPLGSAVVYESHVGTFTPAGTFTAVIEKLDHLSHLGITHVEFMPVVEFPGRHGWGYDGVDLFAPHHAYGSPEDLKTLVNACHARGLAVLLDVVYNHLGPSGNYLGKYGPYFTNAYHTPWGQAVNFDGPQSDEVRRFFCDNALMWLRDFHFDGLRVDAVHAILDRSARPFLEQLGAEVAGLSKQVGRRLVVIAESDLNDPRVVRPPAQGGFGLDAQWSDDFHHALHTALTGESTGYYGDFRGLADLAQALTNAFVFDGRYSRARQRCHGRRAEGVSGHQFLAYAQTHDQVGNRARGERLCHLVNARRAKIAAGLVLTSPFVPLLFQGEEWAASSLFQYFTDHQEPELAQAVGEGRRREFAAFGWNPDEVPDPQASETFERSKVNWSELPKAPHAEMLDWYRRLIELRRQEPALTDGRLDLVRTRFDIAAQWFVLERGPIVVALNLAPHAQSIELLGADHSTLLASEPGCEADQGRINLAPEAIAILKSRS